MEKIDPELQEAYNEVHSSDDDVIDEVWEKAFDYGICISRDDVPKDYEGLNIDENDVEEARFEELQDGEPLTKDELKEFQERWVENASSGQHDADNIPAFALVKVQDPEGKISVALLYRYGYSFSEISTSFSALFSSAVEARKEMEKDGWCF